MTPADLARVHQECFTTPRPWNAAEFTALLASPGVFLVTRPGGFALGRVIAPEAELLTIAVAPTARRQGTGAALMADFTAQARRRGAEESFLEVAADNTAALALYARAGFVQAGGRKGYYSRPDGSAIDAIVMRAVLSGS